MFLCSKSLIIGIGGTFYANVLIISYGCPKPPAGLISVSWCKVKDKVNGWAPPCSRKHISIRSISSFIGRRVKSLPWLLATNLPTKRQALAAYRRRPWIEKCSMTSKLHGFYLEDTHLLALSTPSRLTLAVVLLYVWHFSIGSYAIKRGWRHLGEPQGSQGSQPLPHWYAVSSNATRAFHLRLAIQAHAILLLKAVR